VAVRPTLRLLIFENYVTAPIQRDLSGRDLKKHYFCETV
jgi:hypothetical protein